MNRVRTAIGTSRGLSVAISASAYVVALLVAVFVVRAAALDHPLTDLALGTVVATLVVFAVSILTDNSSIYDPYWSVQPLAIAGYYLWTGWDHVGARQWVVTGLVFLYALRLTSNFYRDWPGLSKEDFRYVEFRERFGKVYWPVSLGGIHLFPTILVYLGCLPLYAVSRSGGSPLGWTDGLAVVVTLGAVALAFVADGQLRRFREEPGNKGRVVDQGLWSVSRHPNYLGEVLTWWGLWLFALAVGPGWWWTGIGAASITAMFGFVSIPWMERRMMATRPGYERYQQGTPVLLPYPSLLRRQSE